MFLLRKAPGLDLSLWSVALQYACTLYGTSCCFLLPRQPCPAMSCRAVSCPVLQDGWLLERPVVERYFGRVETMYVPNPYHNNTHAADVTQTSGVIMRSLNDHLRSSSGGGGGSGACKKCNAGSKALKAAAAGLSKLEKFAIIFASAVHDLAHPGVNNQYLVSVWCSFAAWWGSTGCGCLSLHCCTADCLP